LNKRTRGLLIGTLSGALLGAVLAWALVSREDDGSDGLADANQGLVQASSGDWMRLGLAILQAGRQMADMVRLP
jgi:hypothetical protein